MTDLSFDDMRGGLSGSGLIDDPFWQARAGMFSPIFGKEDPKSGRLSGAARVPPDWCARLGDFLRERHPTKTAEAVAAHCRGEVTAEQVRKWLALKANPSGTAMLWLATCYGPALLLALFGPSPIAGGVDWLGVAAQAQRVDELASRLAALKRDLVNEVKRCG